MFVKGYKQHGSILEQLFEEAELYEKNTFLCTKPRPSSRRTLSCPPRLPDSLVNAATPSVLKTLVEKVASPSSDKGLTLMVRDIPFKVRASEIVPFLGTLGATDVEYAYLPQFTWAVSRAMKSKSVNKGYAFVHFASTTSAYAFVEKVGATHRTSEAKLQGVAVNVTALLHARAINALFFFIRLEGKFHAVRMEKLRSYLDSDNLRKNK